MFNRFDNQGGSFQRPKFQGNWTCSECGTAITELPFEPREGRPIYCQTCHAKRRDQFQR